MTSSTELPWPDQERGSSGAPQPDQHWDEEGPEPKHRLGVRIGLLLAAMALLAWSLLPFVEAVGLPSVLATIVAVLAGGAQLTTIGAIIVATLAAQQRAWESVVIAVIAGLLPWTFVVPYLTDNQPPAQSATVPVHLLLVNAHQGQASAADIISTVTANSVDVLVVTELTSNLAHELTTEGLTRQVTAAWIALPGEGGVANDNEAGTGVWTNLRVTKSGFVPDTTWPAARLELAAGDSSLTLVTAHVQAPFRNIRDWTNDLSALQSTAQTIPGNQVVMANLNATPWNADLRALDQTGLRDAADGLGNGPRPTWPAWSPLPLLALDHVLVSSQIEVTDVQPVAIANTDHRALVVSIKIPMANRPG